MRMFWIGSTSLRAFSGKAHSEAEDFHPFINLRRFFAADCHFHDILHVGDIDAVAGDLGAVDLDAEVGQAADLFHFDVRRSAHCAEDAGDGFAFLLQHVEIFAENLDADGGFDAADHFIDPHGDGLRESWPRVPGISDTASRIFATSSSFVFAVVHS